jgi:glucose dehydrogenase
MRQQITPIVHDGVMFLSTNMSNTVQALDARTGICSGSIGWGRSERQVQNATRTMALYGTCCSIRQPTPRCTRSTPQWKHRLEDQAGGVPR